MTNPNEIDSSSEGPGRSGRSVKRSGRRRTTSVLFVTAFVLCTCLLSAVRSYAGWRRIPANACAAIDFTVADSLGMWFATIRNTSETRGRIVCPVQSLAESPSSQYHGFNLHYYDGHPGQSISARACVKIYNGNGVACDGWYTPNQDGATGNQSMTSPTSTLWETRAADFAFIDISFLQQDCEGTFNRTCSVSGFYGAFLW